MKYILRDIKNSLENIKKTIRSNTLFRKIRPNTPVQEPRSHPFKHSRDAFTENSPRKEHTRPDVTDLELSEVLDGVLKKDSKPKT